jgi:glycerol-3-phosphate dehydrogenase
LLAETACVISPYEAAIAFAENAAQNGVRFLLNTTVTGIQTNENRYTITAGADVFETRTIINASGIHSAALQNQVAPEKETLTAQRGQYFLLDNTQRALVTRTLFQLPTRLGKCVLVAPTVDYNILLGPTAEESEETDTTQDCLSEILEKAARSLNTVPARDMITAFAGIRAKHASKDFVINEPVPGFINALGVDSPGLTAAPAIAERLAEMVVNRLQPAINNNFHTNRDGIRRFHGLSTEEQAELIRKNPLYGKIVCRCETVPEAEIVDAVNRPVGARDLDAVKRRTRAQMGRCQGGFCTVRLMEILSRELNIPENEITKNGAGAWLTC